MSFVATNKTGNTQPSSDTGSSSAFDSGNDDTWKLWLRFAAVPIMLALVATVIFLAALLIAFFLLQARDYQYAYNGLVTTSAEATANFQTAIASVLQNVMIFHRFYDVMPTQMASFYTQSVPIMYANGTFPLHINSVYYVKRIYNSQLAQEIATARAQGPDFVNFNITSRTPTNVIIPYTPNDVYWVVYHVVPNVNINISIGFDYGTNSIRNGTLFRAIATGSIAASGKLAQSRGGYGSVVLIPNFNNTNASDCIGLSGGTIRFDTLLQSSMAKYSANLLVKLTDLNVTGTADDQFLWSTGLINGTTMTLAQNDAVMAQSMFTTTGNVTFGDRLFSVTYAPNSAFISSYATFDKWITLIIFLAAMFVSWGLCVILFFANRLNHSRKVRANSRRQYQLLKDNQENLTSLLRRIANQEQKTRATINALPDFVVVTNANGRIVQFNTAFEELYNHTEQQLADGIFISAIFFKLYTKDSNWFKVEDKTTIETTMETKNGEIPVKVLVRQLNNVAATRDNDLASKLGSGGAEVTDESEDYVIIARPLGLPLQEKLE